MNALAVAGAGKIRLPHTGQTQWGLSDGQEEREESRLRIEQEKGSNREDQIDRDDSDGWEPERQES